MPVQRDVRFLNIIDLLIVGRFDRTPLVTAARKQVFALHEGAPFGGKKATPQGLNHPSKAGLTKERDQLPPT